MRLIGLKFKSDCMGCGTQLPRGTSAYWRKYVGVQCLECGKVPIDKDGMIVTRLPDAKRTTMLYEAWKSPS